MLEVRRISDSGCLQELSRQWDRLASNVPLRSFAWHASWWKHYGDQRGLYALVVHDADESIIGIAPWFVEQRPGQGRVLSWLGSGEVCSDYQSILVQEEHADAVTEALAEWLDKAAGDDTWDLLHLDTVPTRDATVASLVAQLWTGGHTIHREPGPNCWRVELPPSWGEYVDSLSKSHRKQVRRIERRQLETGRAVFRLADSAIELARGLDILVELHQQRRNSLGEPGCFASEQFESFIRDAATHILASGQLRLGWVEVDGEPAAVEFQLADGHVTYAYQAGVNPKLLDEEPGRMINIATIRHAIEEGQRSFDFLRGDEPYKAHWRAEPHATVSYRIVPQKALSQVRHGLWLAKDNVKQWVKSGLELTGMR